MINSFLKKIQLIAAILLIGISVGACGIVGPGPSAPDQSTPENPGETTIFQTYGEDESGLDKPHLMNMDTRQEEKTFYTTADGKGYKKCVAHEWSEEAIYLIGYCIDAENKRIEYEQTLTWNINGNFTNAHYLEIKEDKPSENTIKEYLIEASTDNGTSYADRLIIVVVPPATVQSFSNWHVQEQSDTNWLSEMPRPYAPLYYPYDPEPVEVDPQRWQEPKVTNTYYHPAGYYDMRSEVTSGFHGHQAIYDSNGAIVENGVSAGTADRVAPTGATFALHTEVDVIPFVWACQLDGNPCNGTFLYANMTAPIMYSGGNLRKYLEVRPPLADDPIISTMPTPTPSPTPPPTATPTPGG